MEGWIKLHRKILDNAIFDNADLLKVWIWCLLKATHEDYTQIVGLQTVELTKGQFITGRFKGAEELKLNPSTFYKYLKVLEKLNMIVLNSNNKMTVVTVANWGKYQLDENESCQQNNNNVTTKEQQSNTNKNNKNVKKKDNIPFAEIIDYLNSKTGKNFKHTTKKTQSLITARMREGFTLEDFKKVIDTKVADWKGTEYAKYLRPETLFGTKFEAYLNQEAPASHDQKKNITAQAPGWDTRL